MQDTSQDTTNSRHKLSACNERRRFPIQNEEIHRLIQMYLKSTDN